MKAAVLHGNEDIRYEEFPTPETLPGTVKVRVRATGICGSDVPRVLHHGAHFYPVVLGHEFSGDVVEVGEGVTSVQVGDTVSGAPLLPCMKCDDCQQGNFSLCKHYSFIGSRQQGSFAEYVVMPAQNAIQYDPSIPYEQAAMFEPSTVALHGLLCNGYQGGGYVAILGCGTIVIFTLQWAKIFGSKKIVAFDIDEGRLVIAESDEPGIFQIFLRVGKALVAVIVAVVVCHVDSLHATVCKDFRIFGRSLEGKSLSVSCSGIRESSLKIDDRQVIRIKNRFHILEKISRTVHIVIGVQAGAVIKSFIFSEGAVSGHTYRDRDRFLKTLCFTLLYAGTFCFQRFRLIVGNGFGIAVSGKSTEKQEDQEDQDGGTGGTEDQKHLFFLFRLAQLQKKFSVFRSIHVISFLFEAFS